MPPISIDPTLSASEIVNAHHIENPEDTDRLQLGDIVESWDFTFRWDEDCMPASELEKWRQIPDPLVDEYLATLPTSLLSPKEDQLQILISQAEGSVSSVPSPSSSSTSTSSSNSTPCEPNLAARALLDHLTAAPPDGVKCSDETMRDAQECFYRFAGGLLLGTFYISLVGGFSSPRITSVLHQTSYLVAPIIKSKPQSTGSADIPRDSSFEPSQATSYNPTDDQINDVAYAPITPAVKQRTSVRLLETLQFVLDIMGSPVLSAQNIVPSPEDPKRLVVEQTQRLGPGCMTPLVGEGWKSTVRVRLLHGVVRRRVMSTVGKEREKGFDGTGRKVGYDFEKDGYPLNAEDMLLTLASFCVAPLWACQRIGSPIPARLQSAYIAHWRHVGYYLGVPSSILERHMQVDLEPRKGNEKTDHMRGPNKIFASCLTHLFAHPKDLEDTQRLPPPTLPLLHTASDMPPFQTPLKNHFRAARFFLGDSLATALNIPRTTPFEQLRLRGYFLGVTLPERFGKVYWRRSWDVQRRNLTQHLLGIMVRHKLSGRRSMFRPHAIVPGQQTKQEPDLPDEVIALEKGEGELDHRAAMRSYLKYQALMIEMIVVGLGVVGLGGWAGWRVVDGIMTRLT